jgi:hypothetical protein
VIAARRWMARQRASYAPDSGSAISAAIARNDVTPAARSSAITQALGRRLVEVPAPLCRSD